MQTYARLFTMLLLCDVNKPVARMLISIILCDNANMQICILRKHTSRSVIGESTKTNPIMLCWLLLKIDKICGHICWSRFCWRSMATLSSAVTIERHESRLFNYIYLCTSPPMTNHPWKGVVRSREPFNRIIIIIIITRQGNVRLAPTSPVQTKIQLK